MEFLTRAVESFTGNSIPYFLKEKLVLDIASGAGNSHSLWNIYAGVSTKDDSLVTVFEFDLKNPQMTRYISLAQHAYRKSRSLSLLPGVLTVVDSIQNDQHLYIVTERVRPLMKMISTSYPLDPYPEDLALLGIYQIASAIKFINVEGSSVHCNVCEDSVFVTMAGEWKLGGFEILVNMKERNDFTILSSAYQLPTFQETLTPPEFANAGAQYFNTAKANFAVKFDSFKFGVFAWRLLKNDNSDNSISVQDILSDTSCIPASMAPHLKKCLQSSVSVRYSIQQFLKFGETSFFDTPLINLWRSLSELALKDNDEKMEIFQSFDEIDSLPIGMFEYRILPDLINSFNNLESNENNAQSILLYVILKNSLHLTQASFDRLLKPVIFKAFSYPDRAIRMTLLNALPQIVNQFSNYEIQGQIYPNLVQGFNDTNAAIRQETIKSVIFIVSKISDRQLNNDLLRYLARLQSDEDSEIRTNVVVCLIKVAEHMNSNSRIAVLTTAFGKALKDTFIPTRLNALVAFLRKEAEQTMELYLTKIRTEASELPDEDEETLKKEQEQCDSFANGFNSLSLNKVALNSKKTLFGFGNTGSSASLTMAPAETKSRGSTPASRDEIVDELEFDDDGWDLDEDLDEPAPTVTSTAPPLQKNSSRSRVAPSKHKGLKLQAKSKLNLELEMDDEGWGDECA
ncbi:hypothetical protein FOA43_001133 [Brettanomyces nanus]|uniref:Protein kinase domain-containing protein n=1 Tax=Eeniella nana TaxID=13502 RepID=A0A875S1V4_EENNA|nr:uncharacterized protein FOA43_001133 [Brettanomyces nanus]QPG73819.1 hypothetical protein FOA43_001133 [Brettanomyces nanus]